MQAPKRKTSKSKRNMRRSHHGLTRVYGIACPNCGQTVRPHRICGDCGQYRGRQIFSVDEENE